MRLGLVKKTAAYRACSPGARRLLDFVYLRYESQDKGITASQETIGKRLGGISDRTVRNYVAELRERDLLEIQREPRRRGTNGGWGTNQMRLNMAVLEGGESVASSSNRSANRSSKGLLGKTNTNSKEVERYFVTKDGSDEVLSLDGKVSESTTHSSKDALAPDLENPPTEDSLACNIEHEVDAFTQSMGKTAALVAELDALPGERFTAEQHTLINELRAQHDDFVYRWAVYTLDPANADSIKNKRAVFFSKIKRGETPPEPVGPPQDLERPMAQSPAPVVPDVDPALVPFEKRKCEKCSRCGCNRIASFPNAGFEGGAWWYCDAHAKDHHLVVQEATTGLPAEERSCADCGESGCAYVSRTGEDWFCDVHVAPYLPPELRPIQPEGESS